MVLNARKCKEILICFWKKKPYFQQLTINDYPVQQVKSAKLLGLMLSSDLKYTMPKIGQEFKKKLHGMRTIIPWSYVYCLYIAEFPSFVF